jgi:hypothetical protein
MGVMNQPIWGHTSAVNYWWRPIRLNGEYPRIYASQYSFKNSHYYVHPPTGQEFMFVSAMQTPGMVGGTYILVKRSDGDWHQFLHCHPGWGGQWNPVPIHAATAFSTYLKGPDPNTVYVFVSDFPDEIIQYGFTGDGETVDFVAPFHLEEEGAVEVYLAGVKQTSGYSVTVATSTVTFEVAPALGVAVMLKRSQAMWWYWSRIYYFTVNLATLEYSDLAQIVMPTDATERGILDPYPFYFGGWWYMFHVRLGIEDHGEVDMTTSWNPYYSVSRNLFGPYYGNYDLGLHSDEIVEPYTGASNYIDEAFKVVLTQDRRLFYTHSRGDSGLSGEATFGELKLDTEGAPQDANGVCVFKPTQLGILRSATSCLCTALDISQWPRVFCTSLLKHKCANYSGNTENREGFFIAELI